MFRRIILSTVALLATSEMCYAGPIYEAVADDPHQGSNAGYVSNITTRYDTNNGLFSWQHTIEDIGGRSSDGFWLVVSDGPMPAEDEYTLFYGDLSQGVVSAYQYESSHGGDTWKLQDHYLTSYALNYTHTGSSGTFSFEVDTTILNDASNFSQLDNASNWKGTVFGEWIGVWFAPTLGTAISYLSNGAIAHASAETKSWVDGSYYQTTTVPEPSTFSLVLLLGLVSGALHRQTRR